MPSKLWSLKASSAQENRPMVQVSPRWVFHQNLREATISRLSQEVPWQRKLSSRWERLRPILLEDSSQSKVLLPGAVMSNLACKSQSTLVMLVDLRSINALTESNSLQRLNAQVRNVWRIRLREILSFKLSKVNLWVTRTLKSRSLLTKSQSVMCQEPSRWLLEAQ